MQGMGAHAAPPPKQARPPSKMCVGGKGLGSKDAKLDEECGYVVKSCSRSTKLPFCPLSSKWIPGQAANQASGAFQQLILCL
jgi:hypothetical protein